MCDREGHWLKKQPVTKKDPILLGAPLSALAICMRDFGTGSIPTGYKVMRRVPHSVSWGLRLG